MTKEEKIQEYLSAPVVEGIQVEVMGLGTQNKNNWGNITRVRKVNEDGSIQIKEYNHSEATIPVGQYRKWLGEIGVDPFPKNHDKIRNINFSLESILFNLGLTGEKSRYKIGDIDVMPCNFNPYVRDSNGNKQYFQRDLVWTDADKRLLIDSIYNHVDCGKILVRQRNWFQLEALAKAGETELSFLDIIDGKQRINALNDFVNNKFADSYGNYYRDLSDQAQRKLTNNQLISYSELPDDATDTEVINQFLKLNFTGVPQSAEHINYVKEIQGKLNK